MLRQGDLHLDSASALSLGKRDCQEDAVIADFPVGGRVGLAVLSDGMGGHAAGDVASKIVITEVFSELKLRSGDVSVADAAICELLRAAANGANDCLRAYTEQYPDTAGMGATLVAACVQRNRMHWISIGDSVLFLFRDEKLQQLNEDHSFGSKIDEMVRTGQIPQELAEDYPDRNCLTSVVSGAEIARVDCPEAGLDLRDGDIVVLASDGLQFLEGQHIRAILQQSREKTSGEIAARFLEEIEHLGDPDQDNVSIVVLKVRDPKATCRDLSSVQTQSLRCKKQTVDAVAALRRPGPPAKEVQPEPPKNWVELVGGHVR
ncbi:PP2C family protein-serine/threonine phosphatase [Aliiruegeria lutimaris]|uniref:Serine/threonine protein phosphatase PrpC n=1 Tax=Aliiruegeria lutimaris TaxID=571298 RepID=A0A1G8VGR1_9RHOB|nr:protein phosphatase 2C domain-containing protein [Aliiruegeria lutimaris]SDJ64505.1 Serine/threonine protein phosphatase PrpC [Aliiruegeria lutimaris]